MSSANKAQAQSSAKRMQLSRDQKALLETVYAMEKLPDAALRERLGNHLGLTARQVQVWFQNRRQRSKSTPAEPPVVLNTSDQIMSALFEFGGNLGLDGAQWAGAGGGLGGSSLDIPGGSVGGGGGSSSGEVEGSVAAAAAAILETENFDDVLPEWYAVASSAPSESGSSSAGTAPLAGMGDGSSPGVSFADGASLADGGGGGPGGRLLPLVGFLCESLRLDACDVWRTHPRGSGIEPQLLRAYIPPGSVRRAPRPPPRTLRPRPLSPSSPFLRPPSPSPPPRSPPSASPR